MTEKTSNQSKNDLLSASNHSFEVGTMKKSGDKCAYSLKKCGFFNVHIAAKSDEVADFSELENKVSFFPHDQITINRQQESFFHDENRN